jgi:nucleotide-binding universal stress UspA family protein
LTFTVQKITLEWLNGLFFLRICVIIAINRQLSYLPEKGMMTLTAKESLMIPNIQNILYPTGLGKETPYVFRYALSVAQKYDANIHVIHSHEPFSLSLQNMAKLCMSQGQAEEVFTCNVAEIEKSIFEQLEWFCVKETAKDSKGRKRVASITISELPPKQAILEAEKNHIDLIVMGAHRHSVLAGAMLGTTALKILHHATTPVLIVHIPESYQEDASEFVSHIAKRGLHHYL